MIIYEKEFNLEKSFDKQLNMLYGISKTREKHIRAKLGLERFMKLNKIIDLVQNDLSVTVTEIISKKYVIENSLKHLNILKRRDLRLLGNYKSLRFTQNLPVNGQRTHTNAKTQKNKKR